MREVPYLIFLFERISAIFHLFLFDGSIKGSGDVFRSRVLVAFE
jgi:hypothetical protein